MRTSSIDMQYTCTLEITNRFIANVALAMCSTHHILLGSTPGVAIFIQDMIFGIPHLAKWTQIGKRRQERVDKSNTKEEISDGF